MLSVDTRLSGLVSGRTGIPARSWRESLNPVIRSNRLNAMLGAYEGQGGNIGDLIPLMHQMNEHLSKIREQGKPGPAAAAPLQPQIPGMVRLH